MPKPGLLNTGPMMDLINAGVAKDFVVYGLNEVPDREALFAKVGREIGAVGMGRIGRAIARRLEPFGRPISYHARKQQPAVPYHYYGDLLAMAEAVDTLIAILPGGPATNNLINAAVLEALGPRGVFINVARGSVVDEEALIEALKSRKILRAGLDGFVGEPDINPAVFAFDYVTLVPQIGAAPMH